MRQRQELAKPPDEPYTVRKDGPPRSVVGELSAIVSDLKAHRDLLYYLTLRDVRIRYKQAVMGFAWALLMPALIVGAGMLVQVALARGQAQPLQTQNIAAAAVKALPWAFFVGSLQFATSSLTSNTNLVGKIYFPREVLPLAAVLAQAVDSMIGAVVLIIPLVLLGVTFSTSIFWLPLLALEFFILTAAFAVLLSCANLFFRDIKYLVQLGLTFGIFFVPVLYQPELLGPNLARIILMNPVAVLLEGIYLCTVQGHNLLQPFVASTSAAGPGIEVWSGASLLYTTGWSVASCCAALVIFRRLQYLFAEFV
jgi:ABC-type polysaccharide/polyol phosphate export permease